MLFQESFLVVYAVIVAPFGFKQNPMLRKRSYHSSLSGLFTVPNKGRVNYQYIR
jgi:hypothetical protein